MFVVKYRKTNSTKKAEAIYIRVMEVRDGCGGLAIDVPMGIPVKLEQTVICLVPESKGVITNPALPLMAPELLQLKETKFGTNRPDRDEKRRVA